MNRLNAVQTSQPNRRCNVNVQSLIGCLIAVTGCAPRPAAATDRSLQFSWHCRRRREALCSQAGKKQQGGALCDAPRRAPAMQCLQQRTATDWPAAGGQAHLTAARFLPDDTRMYSTTRELHMDDLGSQLAPAGSTGWDRTHACVHTCVHTHTQIQVQHDIYFYSIRCGRAAACMLHSDACAFPEGAGVDLRQGPPTDSPVNRVATASSLRACFFGGFLVPAAWASVAAMRARRPAATAAMSSLRTCTLPPAGRRTPCWTRSDAPAGALHRVSRMSISRVTLDRLDPTKSLPCRVREPAELR